MRFEGTFGSILSLKCPERVPVAARVEGLRGSYTGDNGLGGLRYLEVGNNPFVEAVFGFEVPRREGRKI